MKKLQIKLSILMLIVLVFLSSMTVNAISVERGSGIPMVDIITPPTINEGETIDIIVNVKNNGADDGFGIRLDSNTGKLLSVGSFTSQYIPTGTDRKFVFPIRTASGKMYTGTASDSELSAREDLVVTVTPEHNLDARVTKNFTINILYKPIEGITPKASGFQVIYVILGIAFVMFLSKRVR